MYKSGIFIKGFPGFLYFLDKPGMQQVVTISIDGWIATGKVKRQGDLIGYESVPWKTESTVASCFASFTCLFCTDKKFVLLYKDGFLLAVCLVNLSLLFFPPAILSWVSAGAFWACRHLSLIASEFVFSKSSLAWISSFCHVMTSWL